jgi:hypothetical protein
VNDEPDSANDEPDSPNAASSASRITLRASRITLRSSQTTQALSSEAGVSQQLFDQTPGGLLDRAIAQELGEAIGTGIDVAVVTALLAVSGAVAVPYTDASPTPAKSFGAIVNVRQQMHTAAGEPPNVLIVHPRRLAYLDETLTNPLQFRMAIVPSPSVPTNLGAGTNEDRVIEIVADDVVLFSRPPELRIMAEVLSGSLSVRIQIVRYFAVVARQPVGVGISSGTGWVSPTL